MSILLSLLLIGTQSQAANRADKFSLDIPADETVTAPAEAAAKSDAGPVASRPEAEKATEPASTPASVDPAPIAPATSAASATPMAHAHVSLDTPIAELIADPRAKAVLDKDMPGLTDDENLAKFQTLSLRRLAPLSGGQMSAELMNTLAYDLAALGGGAPPPPPPSASRKGLPSGR